MTIAVKLSLNNKEMIDQIVSVMHVLSLYRLIPYSWLSLLEVPAVCTVYTMLFLDKPGISFAAHHIVWRLSTIKNTVIGIVVGIN